MVRFLTEGDYENTYTRLNLPNCRRSLRDALHHRQNSPNFLEQGENILRREPTIINNKITPFSSLFYELLVFILIEEFEYIFPIIEL
jgi:hypothetical protein